MSAANGDSTRFSYLGDDIALIGAYYFASVVTVVASIHYCETRDFARPCRALDNDGIPTLRNHTKEYFSGTVFESTYTSFPGKFWTILLLFTRATSFIFFLAVPCILDYVEEHGRNWIYFTTWNFYIITLYFLFVTMASIIGLVKYSEYVTTVGNNFSQTELFLGVTTQIFF